MACRFTSSPVPIPTAWGSSSLPTPSRCVGCLHPQECQGLRLVSSHLSYVFLSQLIHRNTSVSRVLPPSPSMPPWLPLDRRSMASLQSGTCSTQQQQQASVST